MEKNREITEKKLIDAIGELIEDKGFEKVGVNAVSEKAGVSKMLIYRYFGSLDKLIYEYVKRNDFWINVPMEFPDLPELKDYFKSMFRENIVQFRENIALKRLRRWELSSNHPIVVELRAQREANGVRIIEHISRVTGQPVDEVAAIASHINATITYLSLLEENCRMYNGIDIQSDEGWEQIARGIDILIDIIY